MNLHAKGTNKKEKKKSHFSLLYIFQKHKPECCDADGNRRLLSLFNEDQRGRDSNSLQFNYVIVRTHTSLLNNAKRSPESPGIFFFAGDDGRFGGETVCFYSYVEM